MRICGLALRTIVVGGLMVLAPGCGATAASHGPRPSTRGSFLDAPATPAGSVRPLGNYSMARAWA